MGISALAALAMFAWWSQGAPPQEGIEALDFLIGQWTSEEKAFRPGQAPVEFTLKGTNSWALGGAAVKVEESFELPGAGTRHNLIVITFDTREKVYRAWWYSSRAPIPIEFSGKLEGERLALTSEPSAKRPGPRVRVTYVRKTETRMDATLEVEIEGSFQVRTEAKYTKVGS